jgi:acyl-CoA hydrolase
LNRLKDISTLVDGLSAGERIYLPGSAGEVPALTAALLGEAAPPLAITATLVPGINALPSEIRAGTTLSNPFAVAPAGWQATGTFRHTALSYGGFNRALHNAEFDTCFIHVSTPDAQGRVTLGPSVEFTPLAMKRARRIVAVINPLLPPIPGSVSIELSDIDAVVEMEASLRGYSAGGTGDQALRIAEGIARFVEDGSTLQVGLGKVPDALLTVLRDRKKLRFHSGMLSDSFRHLLEAGAVDESVPAVSCVHVGSEDYYAWLAGRPGIAVSPVSHTHDPGRIASLPRFVAVNSALTVDLFGQANLEFAGARAVSGVGGAADFARGATLNPEGISIIGLPALGPKAASRIVPELAGVASLPRQDVDVVVTEFGTADLRGLSVRERGERLVEIAAAEHRSELSAAFADKVARF